MTRSEINNVRIKAFRTVCSALNEQEISWGAIHGVESFPDSVGRDIDILISAKKAGEACRVSEASLKRAGWRTCVIKMPWGVVQVIASTKFNGETIAFEVDFVFYQMWRGAGIITGPSSERDLEEITDGVFRDAWCGFVKRNLIQCLSGNWNKMNGRVAEWSLMGKEEMIVPLKLKKFARKSIIDAYLCCLENRDACELKLVSKKMKKSIILRSLFKPSYYFMTFPIWVRDKIAEHLILTPRAPIVNIEFNKSIPVEEQSAILSQIAEYLRSGLVFPNVVVLDVLPTKSMRRHILKRSSQVDLVILYNELNFQKMDFGSVAKIIHIDAHDDGGRYVIASSQDSTPYDVDGICMFLADRVMQWMHKMHVQNE